jgi:hypothetical protein
MAPDMEVILTRALYMLTCKDKILNTIPNTHNAPPVMKYRKAESSQACSLQIHRE